MLYHMHYTLLNMAFYIVGHRVGKGVLTSIASWIDIPCGTWQLLSPNSMAHLGRKVVKQIPGTSIVWQGAQSVLLVLVIRQGVPPRGIFSV
jgi:hypothetical protein